MLLSAALVLAPFAATPAMAVEGGDVSNAGSTVEKSVAATPQASDAAVVISADGETQTGYEDARTAAGALKDGETLILNEDYTGEWGLWIKAANVTNDLNVHSVTSTKQSSNTSNGYAIKIEKPKTGATNHKITIKNGAQEQSVLSSSMYQVTALSGNSSYTVTLDFVGDIAFCLHAG